MTPRRLRSVPASDFPQGWQFKADISAAGVRARGWHRMSAVVFGFAGWKIRFDPGAPPSIRFRGAARPPDRNGAGVRAPHRLPDTDADADGFNQALSEKRAQAVTDFLVKAGLPAERFTAMGYGSTQPVASNDTEEGKAQNRRIDFVVR
jgi:OOP family OmpA-OmpF porin